MNLLSSVVLLDYVTLLFTSVNDVDTMIRFDLFWFRVVVQQLEGDPGVTPILNHTEITLKG